LGVAAAPGQVRRSPPITTPQFGRYVGYLPIPVDPNRQILPNTTAQQLMFNAAAVGSALSQIPPYALGYNPYPSPVINSGPVLTTSPLTAGLAAPAYTAAMSTTPYSGYGLSTTGGSPGYGGYGSPGYDPYAYASMYNPIGAYYQGVASVTRATGQYFKDIQEARLSREKSRQAHYDTRRKEIEFEAWYESMKLTAPQMRERDLATRLDDARRDPPRTDIWSGKAMNELLRSILRDGKTTRGPSISLEEDTLKHINLTVQGKAGNVGLLKNGGKLDWPLPLEDKMFDEERKELSSNIKQAVDQLKEDKKVGKDTLNNIVADYKKMKDKLENSADEFSPSQYIEANRYLGQVGDAIKALQDSKVSNYFNNTWNAKGKTVAELVSHLKKEGLQFAPAAPGDEAAYNSLYHALRSYEARVLSSNSSQPSNKNK